MGFLKKIKGKVKDYYSEDATEQRKSDREFKQTQYHQAKVIRLNRQLAEEKRYAQIRKQRNKYQPKVIKVKGNASAPFVSNNPIFGGGFGNEMGGFRAQQPKKRKKSDNIFGDL